MGLPAATEDVKWGNDLCFCVGEKLFCTTGLDNPLFAVTLRVLPEEFHEMCSRPGIRKADYIGRYNGITVEGGATLTEKEWDHYVKQSYRIVRDKLPKKIKLAIGVE